MSSPPKDEKDSMPNSIGSLSLQQPDLHPAVKQRMKYHKKAFKYLDEALKLEERGGEGTQWKERAIHLYQLGIEELGQGIGVSVPENVGESQTQKTESLCRKMTENLEMAQERIRELRKAVSLAAVASKDPPSLRPSKPSVQYVLRPKKPRAPSPKVRRPAAAEPQLKRFNSTPSSSAEDKLSVPGVDQRLVDLLKGEIIDKSLSVRWTDIAGLQLAKESLQEMVILPAQRPELFTGLRSPARGLLLFGPPGNGKTMLAKAVASESSATFFNISASSLTSKWLGEGEKMVKALFAMARSLQPSVIFIDEIDSLLSERKESEHEAMRRIKTEFLVSFDGLSSTQQDRVIVMGATNRPQDLDDAALRRLVKRVYVPLPDQATRRILLDKLLQGQGSALSEKQFIDLAKATAGYSASDTTALARDAAMGPLRDLDSVMIREVPADQVRKINFADFQLSLKRIRPSVSIDSLKVFENWNRKYGSMG
eukprot:m.85612 g.85612  ORF g.85612 m.85612 type:complete len:482 (+) comp36452_c0_seq17:114-1559(+)